MAYVDKKVNSVPVGSSSTEYGGNVGSGKAKANLQAPLPVDRNMTGVSYGAPKKNSYMNTK